MLLSIYQKKFFQLYIFTNKNVHTQKGNRNAIEIFHPGETVDIA